MGVGCRIQQRLLENVFVKNDEILLYGETEIRIKSGEIEKMTVFPISRAMLHSTPAAPGRLKPKKNMRPDPLRKPSSPAVWSNQSQQRLYSEGSGWGCPLFPSSLHHHQYHEHRHHLRDHYQQHHKGWGWFPTMQHQAENQNVHNNEFVFRWSLTSLSTLAKKLWIVNVDVVYWCRTIQAR